jgi:hypothetical protein
MNKQIPLRGRPGFWFYSLEPALAVRFARAVFALSNEICSNERQGFWLSEKNPCATSGAGFLAATKKPGFYWSQNSYHFAPRPLDLWKSVDQSE